ncbi:MAG: MBL fold metallo-hydrolase [Planctomycetota bacterium]
MLFEQFVVPGLAHFSYAVGCETAREVAIVDPTRDIDTYLDFARARRVRISRVLETHVHADFASGAKELAERTGAELNVSAYDKGETFEVAFPHRDLYEDDGLRPGSLLLRVLHTPGHTPEHIALLVFDHGRSKDVPVSFLTGDFLLAGSLGRPDLLGDALAPQLARELFRSVQSKLKALPDGLIVYPAHGAGSMCASRTSAAACTTLGWERATNRGLDGNRTEAEFMSDILGSLPPRPEYFARLKRLNCTGPKSLEHDLGKDPIDAREVHELHSRQACLVIDVRHELAFAAGHIPGAYALAHGPLLSVWAGWVLPPDIPIVLVVSDPGELDAAVRSLVRVGLDDIRGYLAGGMDAWCAAGLALSTLPQLRPADAWQLQREGRLAILDVRAADEWRAARVPDSLHVQGWQITESLDRLRRLATPLTVLCNTGYVSTVVASLLERSGFEALSHVTGGLHEWQECDAPLDRGPQCESRV